MEEAGARGWAEAEAHGPAPLFAALSEQDPVAAQSIGPHNVRRVIRALEVVEITGRQFSASMPERRHLLPTVMVGLRPPRGLLDERIDGRVEQMWHDGLVDEVRSLVPQGIREGRTASRALGYAQALAQLSGAQTEADAIAETQALTRRYARRQVSWFRRYTAVTWVAPDVDATALVLELDAPGA